MNAKGVLCAQIYKLNNTILKPLGFNSPNKSVVLLLCRHTGRGEYRFRKSNA